MTEEQHSKIKDIIQTLMDEMDNAKNKKNQNDISFSDISTELYYYNYDERFIASILDTIYEWTGDYMYRSYGFDEDYIYDIIERYIEANLLYEKYQYKSENSYLDTYNALDKDNDFITFDMIETIFTVIDIIINEFEWNYTCNAQYKLQHQFITMREYIESLINTGFIYNSTELPNTTRYATVELKNLVGRLQKYWKK
jgi:hypothetical protein